jgi:molybdopterin adenylyltransferase
VSIIKIGILTVSDRASQGIYSDISGKAIEETLQAYLNCEWQVEYRLIPDEQVLIEQTLIELADTTGCCLVVTTGGTGPALRDVTPEATEAVCQKLMPGFGELMRTESLRYANGDKTVFRRDFPSNPLLHRFTGRPVSDNR